MGNISSNIMVMLPEEEEEQRGGNRAVFERCVWGLQLIAFEDISDKTLLLSHCHLEHHKLKLGIVCLRCSYCNMCSLG